MSRRIRNARCVGALVLQLTAHSSLAQTRASAPNLDAVVAMALRNNADVLLARLRADSAHGGQRLARAFPNPQFGSAPNQPWQYTLTLPLDITPERLFRTRAAAHGTDAALDDASDMERQVRFGVRQAFLDVLLAEQQRDVADERRDIFRRLLGADSARLQAGDIPQRDLTKAELEDARADADYLRAVGQVHAARLTLQLLMGNTKPDTGFQIAGDLVYRAVDVPADSLAQFAMRGRPDVHAARERLEQSRANSALASASLVPLPVLTFSHTDQIFPKGDLFTFGTRNSIGFGFTFPLFYFNGGERQMAHAAVDGARIASGRLEAEVANDVATALDAYHSSRTLCERYESGLLARAQSVLETARYAYGTGAVSLLELLDAIATYSDTRSDYERAIHDYWVAVYGLEWATGREWLP